MTENNSTAQAFYTYAHYRADQRGRESCQRNAGGESQTKRGQQSDVERRCARRKVCGKNESASRKQVGGSSR